MTRIARIIKIFVALLIVVAPTISAENATKRIVFHPAQAMAEQATVTVTTRFPNPSDTTGVLLTGFSTNIGAKPILLALTWTQNVVGWFPTWQLQLHFADGLLPIGVGTKSTHSGWMGTDYIVLSQTKPIANQSYEVSTSYDAAKGSLSLRVLDVTTGETVYGGGFQMPPYAGPLYVTSGLITDAGSSNTVGSISNAAGASATPAVSPVRISPGYRPLGVSWATGELSSDHFMPLQLFERHESAAAVELKVPGALPQGVFRISHLSAGYQTKLAELVPNAERSYLPLPIADLPLGKSTLIMEYIENGQPLIAAKQEITIGNVSARFDIPQVDWDKRLIHSTLQMQSQGAMSGLSVNVSGTLYATHWDEEKRSFVDMPFAADVPLFNGQVELPSGKPLLLPLHIPLPGTPGMWRLHFAVTVAPEVRFRVSELEHVFTSYKQAQLASDQPYSFVVLPDTQLMTRDFPQVYMRMMQWIAEKSQSANIALVMGVGDITQTNAPKEWEQARKGFDLLKGVVPYIISVGDHDMVQGSVVRGGTLVDSYFQAAEFPHLTGLYKPGALDNAYYKLTVGDSDYMVVVLEFAPRDEVLDWANKIVAQNTDRKVIVLTHAYVNGLAQPMARESFREYSMSKSTTTTMNTGFDMWIKFIKKHANIIMTISGHTGSVELPYYVAIGDHGNKILQLLVNWQDEELGGNGWLAQLTITPDRKLEARVYSPYLGEYKTEIGRHGYTNHFIADLDEMWVNDLPN